MSKKRSRPEDCRRVAYMLRFGLSYRKPRRMLPDRLLKLLGACKSDEARRLLLGISQVDRVRRVL